MIASPLHYKANTLKSKLEASWSTKSSYPFSSAFALPASVLSLIFEWFWTLTFLLFWMEQANRSRAWIEKTFQREVWKQFLFVWLTPVVRSLSYLDDASLLLCRLCCQFFDFTETSGVEIAHSMTFHKTECYRSEYEFDSPCFSSLKKVSIFISYAQSILLKRSPWSNLFHL